MTKVLRIEEGGYVWVIPAEKIAENRADYYADLESQRGTGAYDLVYQEEFEETMADDEELREWYLSNMDYSDVQEFSRLIFSPVPPKHPTFHREVDTDIDIQEISLEGIAW